MSSEYSSAGEESGEELGQARRVRWATTINAKASEETEVKKGGWADGVAEKVLEVRTPRWRSDAVSLYIMAF